MTYPLLEMREYRAYVEVARGRKLDQWNDMTVFYEGSAEQGKQWSGPEGTRLAIRYSLFADDPSSDLSWPPITVDGHRGIGTGKPELRKVP